MRLRELGAAVLIIAAVCAVLASSASATATTESSLWYTGTTEAGVTPLTGEQSLVNSPVGTATLTTHISGYEVKVTAGGIECVGCVIDNGAAGATGHGKLEFTAVTVDAPSGCTAPTTITSKELTLNADYMESGYPLVKFTPTAGEENAFATFELAGASCPIATNVTSKGTLFGKVANPTGSMKTEQTVSFSKAINQAAGGNFHVGTEEMVLTATEIFKTPERYFGIK